MQESTLMGGGSLVCLLHYLSLEISIALVSRRLNSGTSPRGRSRDSISGVGSTNRKWNLGVTSGFLTLRKEQRRSRKWTRELLVAATPSYPVRDLPQEINWKWQHFRQLLQEKNRK
jgi:hypothetical protein